MLLRSQLEDAEIRIQELSKQSEKKNALINLAEDDPSLSLLDLLSLRRVNFECQRGTLVAVVGSVGAGKSTFINAILGEVRALSGSVFKNGRVAYFAQTPFILNDTLKANVLFGRQEEPFDEHAYKNAISVCALEHDLQILPGGDACEIGEKGITLSGGQKARVAMARVVYHDADVYLLDDPLAAVDAHVGKHLFEKCIVNNLLLGDSGDSISIDGPKRKQRIVILVTNALQYLSNPLVDRILVLHDGVVHEEGTYAELTKDPSSLFLRSLRSFQESLSEDSSSIPEKKIELTPIFSQLSLNALEDTTDEPEVANILLPLETREQFRVSLSLNRSISRQKSEDEHEDKGGVLTTDELVERDIGHVSLSVYLSWAKAAGGAFMLFLIILSYGAVEGVNVLSRWWLTYWSLHGAGSTSQAGFLIIYAIINLSAVLATFVRLIFITICGLRASRKVRE